MWSPFFFLALGISLINLGATGTLIHHAIYQIKNPFLGLLTIWFLVSLFIYYPLLHAWLCQQQWDMIMGHGSYPWRLDPLMRYARVVLDILGCGTLTLGAGLGIYSCLYHRNPELYLNPSEGSWMGFSVMDLGQSQDQGQPQSDLSEGIPSPPASEGYASEITYNSSELEVPDICSLCMGTGYTICSRCLGTRCLRSLPGMSSNPWGIQATA